MSKSSSTLRMWTPTRSDDVAPGRSLDEGATRHHVPQGACGRRCHRAARRQREHRSGHSPAGTLAFLDTCRCFHMGSRKANKPRYAIMIQYQSPYAASFPMEGPLGNMPIGAARAVPGADAPAAVPARGSTVGHGAGRPATERTSAHQENGRALGVSRRVTIDD